MRRSPSILIVAMSLAVCAVAGQASAGQGRPRSAPPSSSSRGSSSQGGQSGQSSQPSQSDRGRSQAQSREREAPPPQQAQTPPQSRPSPSSPQPRGDVRPSPNSNDDTRNYSTRGNDTRSSNSSRDDNRGGQQGQAGTQRQAVPRPDSRYDSNGHDNRYDSRYDSRGYGGYRYDGYGSNYRYAGSRVIIAPRYPMRFTSAWFSFRPYFRLSIGLTMGYPIVFPTWYDPYMVGTVGYARPYMAYGGVSFDVEPRDAELWVDGDFIGKVSDYSSYGPPLTLVAGRHHVELTGRNYQSIAFDITVVAGQVIPYQGTLPYIR